MVDSVRMCRQVHSMAKKSKEFLKLNVACFSNTTKQTEFQENLTNVCQALPALHKNSIEYGK